MNASIWTEKENSPDTNSSSDDRIAVAKASLCVCEFLSCPDQLLAHAQHTFLVEMWGQLLVHFFLFFFQATVHKELRNRPWPVRKRNKKEVLVDEAGL
jgi:hypothetical protein